MLPFFVYSFGNFAMEVDMPQVCITVGHNVRVCASHLPQIHGMDGVVTEVTKSKMFTGSMKYKVYLAHSPVKYHHLYGFELILLGKEAA